MKVIASMKDEKENLEPIIPVEFYVKRNDPALYIS